MSSAIEFVSQINVVLIQGIGNDLSICRSAWASSGAGADESEKKQRALIRTLLRKKHGSPFESGFMEFWVDAPRAVRDEHVRHRIGSYSSSSLRYREGAPRVWIPPQERPLLVGDTFKPMEPTYETMDNETYWQYSNMLIEAYTSMYEQYDKIKAAGFDTTEALRWITTDGLMTPYICRFNPRSLMHFLALRTHEPESNHPSYPMWEIEQVARQFEKFFSHMYPLTYAAFNEYGREAP